MNSSLVETVIDTEGNGLLDTITKFHCLSWRDANDRGTVYGNGSIVEWLKGSEGKRILICHNMIDFDLRAFKLLLSYNWEGPVIDTLPLSWYLFPNELRHGLEEWGDTLGIPKVPIDDWENLPVESYGHRCEVDVDINWALWLKLKRKLQVLYDK